MIQETGRDLSGIDKKLSAYFGLLIVALLVIVSFTAIVYFNFIINKEHDRLGSIIANSVGNSINRVSFSGKYQARLLVEDLKNENINIDSIIIQDSSGLIIAHSTSQFNGQILDDALFQEAKKVITTDKYMIRNITLARGNQPIDLIEIDIPYKKGYEDLVSGVTRVFLSKDSLNALIHDALIYLSFLIAFLAIFSYFIIKVISAKLSAPIIEQKQFFEHLLNIIPSPIFYKDIEGRYIGFNNSFELLLGKTKEELLGKSVFDTSPPELAAIYHEKDMELFTQNTTQTYESSIKDSEGKLHTVVFNKASILDANNHISGLIGVILDITTQKELEKELLIQKEKFETIFKNSTDGLAVFDLESHFLECNDAYLQMTGFTKEELLTKTCLELTAKEDIERSKEALAIVLKEGYIENFEKSCIVKDDKVIIINMGITLIPDQQKLIVVAKNITNNKFLESQAKLASMGEMIGNIAHQWRQPLSVVSTIASSIAFKEELNRLKSEEIIPNMESIIKQTTYLSKTIDDFRNFIKGDNMKTTTDIQSIIDKTLSIVTPSLKNSYIDVVLDIEPDLQIECFENELMQAFINIINNSKDAIVSNENIDSNKYIFISAQKKNNAVQIIIKDNGGGIKQEVINRIFEPYFTTKHKSVGTGLGLSMAYKIISEIHHGNIQVINSTFEYNHKSYTGAMFILSFYINSEKES